MPAIVSRRVATLSARGFVASFTAQVSLLAGWGVGVWDTRPHLTVMTFGLLMTASIVTGLAAILARCHLSIAQAFAAGVALGRAAENGAPAEDRGASVRALRIVD